MFTLIPLGLIVWGIVNCLFGFKVFRISIALTGFVIFAIVAGILSKNNPIIMIIAGIVGGYIQVTSYRIGIYMIGSLVGILLVSGVLNLFGIQLWVILWALWIVVGLFAGRIALMLEKLMVILNTSFGGALAIVVGFLLLVSPQIYSPLGFQVISSIPLLGVIVWLGLGIAGVIFQFGGPENVRKQYDSIVTQVKGYEEKRKLGTKPSPATIAFNVVRFILPEIGNIEPVQSSAGWISGLGAFLFLASGAWALSSGGAGSSLLAIGQIVVGDFFLLRFINFRAYVSQTKQRVGEEAGRYGKLGKL